MMDLRHDHGALIHVARACDNADAPDLVAIGGENSVSVLLIVCATASFVISPVICIHRTFRRVRVWIDRHFSRPRRVLSLRIPHHRSRLVPPCRLSIFVRSMVY